MLFNTPHFRVLNANTSSAPISIYTGKFLIQNREYGFNPMLYLTINSECLYNSAYKAFPGVEGTMRKGIYFRDQGNKGQVLSGTKRNFRKHGTQENIYFYLFFFFWGGGGVEQANLYKGNKEIGHL